MLDPSERILGVKIYHQPVDSSGMLEQWRAMGLNAAFLGADLLADRNFRALARDNRIALFVILPVFYNPQALADDPSLYALTDRGERAQEEWVQFICPTRQDYLQDFRERAVRLIDAYQPDGISLDFIRHFVYWEKVYPQRPAESIPEACFDPSCMKAFQRESGIVFPETARLGTALDIARWIRANCHEEWVAWKCGVITSTVQAVAAAARASKPDLLVNLHAVPWRETDFDGAIRAIAGQDFAQLAPWIDYISPMCYAHMLKREPDWIPEVVQDIHRQSQGKILPSIQVKEHYLRKRLTLAEFRHSLEAALRAPSRGVVFWSWESLQPEHARKRVIAEILNG